jgi:hypothetical protein
MYYKAPVWDVTFYEQTPLGTPGAGAVFAFVSYPFM